MEREWKAMMKLALDYYPESTIQQVCNGSDDTFLEFMLGYYYDYQKPSVRFEVTQLAFNIAYKCLIKAKSSNGELPLDYKYLPIHPAIELLHDKNYSSFDRFCALQFSGSTSLAYTRQLK
jgi:hypothetical protein